jgi:carbamoyl-phosphate synthase small subunit
MPHLAEPRTALASLFLEDGTIYHGEPFGARKSAAGEVVFSTGMVGYPEAMTDPSFYGQILVFTFPLIGNYGIPDENAANGILEHFESSRIQTAGIIVSEYSREHSHWEAIRSLSQWMESQGIPGLMGVDTRALTKRLREKGSMLGKIEFAGQPVEFTDPNSQRLVEVVSHTEPRIYGTGTKRVLLLDLGCKESIISNTVARGVEVKRVPWNHDLSQEEYDGLLVSSGPGDPKICNTTIHQIRTALRRGKPFMGICLGHQLLALAIGADTFKLKYGHRSQNQPVRNTIDGRCYVTSQNHGYAVDTQTLPEGWISWFENLNDGTNEGLRHVSKPFFSVQFHPEAAPGPVDTQHLFDDFIELVKRG